MPIVTIRGQLGSGVPEIGKLVSEKLHIDYVDRKIIADVANRLHSSKDDIERKEMPSGTLLAKITESLASTYSIAEYPYLNVPISDIPPDDTSYLAGLTSVVKELARSNAMVIRGRGSQFILKDYPNTIHVLLVASFKIRLERVAEEMKIDEVSAKAEIERFDKRVMEFTKRYFKADLLDPQLYDLIINTKNLTYEAAASLIVNASASQAGK